MTRWQFKVGFLSLKTKARLAVVEMDVSGKIFSLVCTLSLGKIL